MNTREAAHRLGLSTNFVHACIASGTLAASFDGYRLDVTDDALDAYIEACRIQPGALAHLHPERTTP
jgi:excisionase family DNA binding protein